jgi:hypothetical protein
MGGNLNVVANAGTDAGVIDGYRASGSATISVGSGTTINADKVSLTIDTGAGQTNKASGDIVIAGTVNAKTIKVINKGPTAGSDVVINSGGKLVGSGGGDEPTVVVAAAGAGGGTFTNNAGSLALQGGPSGYYNVFSDTPVNTLEGLTGYSKLYDQAYDAAVSYDGNRFFYKVAPTLNVTVQNASKTYDGSGVLPSLTYNATGYIDGDSGSLTGSVEATGFTKNVGFYNWGIGSLDSSLGYKINLVSGNGLQVNRKALTVTATGNNKIYDGTLAATVNVGDNRINGDTLTIARNAAFSNKNVGNGKAVSVTGISISGADANNYSLTSTTAAATANITQRTLNVGAVAANKVYDGSAAASVTFTDNHLAGDNVSVNMGGAAFGDKNAGLGKTVDVTGLSLSGGDAGNYALSSTTATTTADIVQRQLTVGLNAADKVYDGAVAATVGYSDNRINGDVLGVSGNASFSDKNTGNGKTVTASGLVLSGADAGNYALASATATGTASITPRSLSVTATGNNKVYDGTSAATVNLSDNRIAGDILGVSGSASFGGKNVGTGKAISVTGITLSGADSGNYALSGNTAATTGDITQRILNVTLGAANKIYDGTTAATVSFGDDRVAGDVLGVSGSASFDTKNAGNGKTVNVSGLSLSGADSGNYALSGTTGSTTADISQRALSVSAAAANKVYDGSVAASVTLGDDRVAGDVLGVSGSASFDTKNAGNGKTVNVSGLSLSGADAGNYVLSSTTAQTTADIAQRTLSVTAVAANKVYDQSAAASVMLGDDRVSGDVLVLGIGSAAFSDKNVGAGKAVSIDGISLLGADSANYVLASTHASASADITPRALAVAATGANKIYDGTTAVSVSYADNRIVGDSLTVSGNAEFADKNAGAGKAINVTGLALSGADAGNYTLSASTASAQADIARRALTVTANGNTKVYDGNTVAALSLSDNRVAGDTLTLSASGTFSDKNVGNGKAVTASGITVTGADAGNYLLTSATAQGTGSITPRALSASVAAADKVYDGTADASVVLIGDDRVAGDQLVLARGAGSFADKNAGSGKAVALTGLSLGGADAGNYTVSFFAKLTADILQRALLVNVSGIDKVYDGSRDAMVTYGDDRVTGDSLVVSGSAAFADRNAGADKTVTVSGLALSGADAANYVISNSTASSSASITAKALVVRADDHVRAYGGNNPALTWTANGLVGGDTESLLDGVQASTSATRESGAGNYAIRITGNSLANYAVTYVDGVLVVQRAPQEAENAIGSAVNPVLPGQVLTTGQGGNWGAQLANDGGTLVPMPAAVAKETNLVNPAPAEAAAQLASGQAGPVAPHLAAPVQGAVNAALAQPQPQQPAGELREHAIGGGSRVMVLDGGVNTGGAPN